jgi:glycosyltransferase involved in cell wall biosynthesis
MAKAVEAWGGRAATVVHPVGPSLPDSAGARWDGPVVCVAAQWSSIKGIELLPDLATAAGAPHGREFRVTERGLDATQREALRGVGAVLVPVGPIDALLAGAALVLVPSLWDEPFGRVAWEALARGVPVLASAAGGMAEHVPPELLVAPREDAAAWAAAIGALLGDEAAWRLAADRARGQAAAILDPVPLDVLEGLLREVSPE